MDQDIRWHQRFSNYRKALARFNGNIAYIVENFHHMDFDDEQVYQNIAMVIDDIIKQGLIQSFEFTHELAWKTLKDIAEDQGYTDIKGSKDATRYAAQVNLISQAHHWMDMIQSRNKTSHTYNVDTANEIFVNIIAIYTPLFNELEDTLETLRSGEQQNMF